ncbi:MAG: hypothetical protein ABEJ68_08675 [Halobacteriaceae archaeon]
MADRVALNFRVSQDAKTAFDAAVADEYGTSDSYAGFVLERELRAELGQGHVATVREAVEDLAESIENTSREKDERQSTPEYFSARNGDTTVVRYRVAEDIRDAIKEQQSDAFRSAGEFVEAVMMRYAETDGELVRIAETVNDLAEELAYQDDDEMTTTDRIASRLDDSFTQREFLDAAEKEGIGTKKYALEEYLPGVLDTKDVIPAPGAPETFVPRGSASDSGPIDPARLPYHAMSREEKRTAIKVEALRELDQKPQRKLKMSPSEGCSILEGRPKASTVRSLYREIANETSDNGFWFDDGFLKVSGEQAREAEWVNETALRIANQLSDSDEASSSEDTSHRSNIEKQADKEIEALREAIPASETDQGERNSSD